MQPTHICKSKAARCASGRAGEHLVRHSYCHLRKRQISKSPAQHHVAFFLEFGERNPDGTWYSFWIVEQFKGLGS
jgi:hypothetical protein